MRDLATRLEERQRHDFRRFMIASAVLHVVAVLAMFLSPSGPSLAPPLGVRVQLVAAPPAQAAKPRATPAPPKPAPPKPKPKPPTPEKVVLPAEPLAPKPEPKPLEPPKPVEKPKPVEQPKPPEPAPQEEEYVDVMDQLRAELGEDVPDELPQEVAQAGPSGTPDGAPVSAELAAWQRAVQAHVRRNWVVPPAFEMQSLVTVIDVDLDAAGNVRGEPSVAQRSGNPWYDENVVRSIKKASPMPAPPRAGSWTFVFQSDRD